jgi:RNA polymerase sigma-70 factor, ECF subfamily
MAESHWTVYEQHAAALRCFIRRRVEADAVEDVLADTFAVAWRRLPRELADDPLPWLYGVAARVIANHRRGMRRRARLVTRLISHHGDHRAPEPSELVVGDPQLARAFAALSTLDQEAIRLVAWEGLTHEQAGRAAGCSAATFAVRFSRARTRLAAALEAEAVADDEEEPLRAARASATTRPHLA